MIDTMEIADKLANIVYDEYNKAGDCGILTLQWMADCLWGKIAEHKIIPTVRKLFNLLKEKNHNEKNYASLGDLDYKLWFEEPEKDIKIIISVCNCACADDNTMIFYLDDRFANQDLNENWVRLKIMTAWSKEVSINGRCRWGDDRDIKFPSINTYRNNNWKFGYEDTRDINRGFVMKYDSIDKYCKDIFHTQDKTQFALDTIKTHIIELTEGGV